MGSKYARTGTLAEYESTSQAIHAPFVQCCRPLRLNVNTRTKITEQIAAFRMINSFSNIIASLLAISFTVRFDAQLHRQ